MAERAPAVAVLEYFAFTGWNQCVELRCAVRQAADAPGRERLVMFQETALFPRFTVLRNVIFGLKLRDDLSDAERRRIAHQHLELVEPDKFAHANVHEFFRRHEAGRKAAARGLEDCAQEAIDLLRETTETLYEERRYGKALGSMVKQTSKRRQPGFNESFYGFASFNELLEEAQASGQLEFEMDKKSGGCVICSVTQPL